MPPLISTFEHRTNFIFSIDDTDALTNGFIEWFNFNQSINPEINRLFSYVASSELESLFKIRTL